MPDLPNISPTVNAIFPSSTAATILSVYNDRADKIAAVNQANLAFNRWATSVADDLAGGTESRTITLELYAAIVPVQLTVARNVSPGSPGNPPTSNAQPATSSMIASVKFDISLDGGMGFVQRITDHAEANQSIHQTAGGFYVDQWGMKPGDFNLEATIVFTSDIATHVQVFKDLLFKAKRINKRTIDPPPRLMYRNAVDGRTLLLTQASLDISQAAENPNMATISIRGSILTDYATATITPTDSATATVSSTGLDLATNGVGALTDTATSKAGTAALT